MMTQRQNTCRALQLGAEEATKWLQLGFEDDSQAQDGQWCQVDFAKQQHC